MTASLLMALLAAAGTSTSSMSRTATAALPRLVSSATTSAPVKARASMRAVSRTLLLIAAEPVVQRVGGVPRVVSRRVAPIVEELTLGAQTGIQGLTISVDGWLAVEAGERILSSRALADLTEGFIEWRRPWLAVTAGRIQSFSATGRGLRYDGGSLSFHPRFDKLVGIPLELRLEVFGGVPVTPRFGEEPLLVEPMPPIPTDALDLANGGTDWQRPGDSCFGALLGFGNPARYFGSFGYSRTTRVAEVDREALVGLITLHPLRSLGLEGFVSYDVFARALEDSELVLIGRPAQDVRLTVYGRAREPALLLPSTSILSVFGGSGHQELGASLDWSGRVGRLTMSGELRRTLESPDGVSEDPDRYRLGATEAPHGAVELRGPIPLARGRVLIGFEVLGVSDSPGYGLGRLGVELPLTRLVSLSAEVAGIRVESTQGESGFGGRASLAATLSGSWWRLVAAIRGTESPTVPFSSARQSAASDELAVLGRFEWRSGTRF
ncbi:MAG: hypothetical protein HY791_25455 [Deltaproteobacteria bacterium]|nr:hypothetical protein [Deltaproteobacteria bacterium]